MADENDNTNMSVFDWGIIAAFDESVLNRFLGQIYIYRYNTDDFLAPVYGQMSSAGGEWRYNIEGFLLDKPRMVFESADMNGSKANMIMKVLGGNLVTQKRVGEQWHTQSIEYFSPAQGPLLRFNLNLPDTPIDVDADGTLFIDLKDSDDFFLEFNGSTQDQKLIGDFFKTWFSQLDESQRRYPFGKIAKGHEEWSRPSHVYLRTQSVTHLDGTRRGAVLLFMQIGNEPKGAFPDATQPMTWLLGGAQ